MKRKLIGAAAVPLLGLAMAACTVEQTEEGRAPTVEPGEAPAYEVQPADVNVEWDTTVVRVPDVELSPQEDTVGTGVQR